MNKVDIVIKHIGNDDFYDMNGTPLLITRILAAMDEYAQQQVKNCSMPAVSKSFYEGYDFHEDQTVWTGGRGTGASLRGKTDV